MRRWYVIPKSLVTGPPSSLRVTDIARIGNRSASWHLPIQTNNRRSEITFDRSNVARTVRFAKIPTSGFCVAYSLGLKLTVIRRTRAEV